MTGLSQTQKNKRILAGVLLAARTLSGREDIRFIVTVKGKE
jgi:hypothetical protein